jgi:hypothetical protein
VVAVSSLTLQNEAQFVLPTCGNGIAWEFGFCSRLCMDGACADYPGTLAREVEENSPFTHPELCACCHGRLQSASSLYGIRTHKWAGSFDVCFIHGLAQSVPLAIQP